MPNDVREIKSQLSGLLKVNNDLSKQNSDILVQLLKKQTKCDSLYKELTKLRLQSCECALEGKCYRRDHISSLEHKPISENPVPV